MIPETVKIKISNGNAQRYIDLGYEIPRNSKFKQTKHGYALGTEIEVKVSDLSRGSNTRVLRTCDQCGKKDLVIFRYMTSSILCASCSQKGTSNAFYGKKHSVEVKAKIKQTKESRDYSKVYQKIGIDKCKAAAQKAGFQSSEDLQNKLIAFLEIHGCGIRSKYFKKHFSIGSTQAFNTLVNANRRDLLERTPEFQRKDQLVKSQEQKLRFAKKAGYKSYADLEADILNYFEQHPTAPCSDGVIRRFPRISTMSLCNILKRNGKHALFRKFSSTLELDLADFVKSLDPTMQVHQNTRKVIQPKELDIYIPAKAIAIEFNGVYWHSELQKDPNYHVNKRLKCEAAGVSLIQINSDEWAYCQDIVKSIIKMKLGFLDRRIFARKTQIQKVSRDQAETFLEENRLMGTSRGSKAIGLFYKTELVSLLTYRKFREGVDIARFCTIKDTQVLGGLSKLLRYIERQEPKIQFIQSFVDLRYANGHSLLTCGFKLEKVTRGWKWTDFDRTYNRLKCRANMDERGLSQNEQAAELGWAKIYDAGQARFLKKISL